MVVGGLYRCCMVSALVVGLSFLGEGGGCVYSIPHRLDCGVHWMKVKKYLGSDTGLRSLSYLPFLPIATTPEKSLPVLEVSSQTPGLPTTTKLDERHVLVLQTPRERPPPGLPKTPNRLPEPSN